MNRARSPYRWLAEYYDTIFTFHEPWAVAAHHAILGPIMGRVESACDLACGSGTTALNLAKQGVRTYAVDLSPGMCRRARQRARETGLRLRISLQDMRRFRLPEQVDLVLCEFDALNHIPHKTDLPRVFKAVARALKPGGYFFFDVNNRLGFESYWKGTVCLQKPGIVLIMNNGNDAAHDRAWADCLWFIKRGALWSRHTERVEEVCWSRQELRRALRQAGFSGIRAWDSTPFLKDNPIVKPGCRTHYLARKAASAAGQHQASF